MEFTSNQLVPIAACATTRATLAVQGGGRVGVLRVQVQLEHSWCGDLILTLVSPGGTRVLLASHAGDAGSGYDGTVFDDGASRTIDAALPPLRGSYRPEEPLGILAGSEADGTWTLEIEDTAPNDEGSLIAWSLDLAEGMSAWEPEQRVESTVASPTKSNGLLVSTIDVAEPGRLEAVSVTVDLTHGWCGDLRLTLVHPDGERVTLAEHEGGGGEGFAGTVFVDDAPRSIRGMRAPFAGSFRPAEPLSALRGKAAVGTWKLEVHDDGQGDEGRLNAWGLAIWSLRPASAQPAAEPVSESVSVSEPLTSTGSTADANARSGARSSVSVSVSDPVATDSDSVSATDSDSVPISATNSGSGSGSATDSGSGSATDSDSGPDPDSDSVSPRVMTRSLLRASPRALRTRPALVFYELMTADWLEAHALGLESNEGVEDGELQVDDDGRYGRVLAVDLDLRAPAPGEDLTIKITAALQHRRSGSAASATGVSGGDGPVGGSLNVMIAERPIGRGSRTHAIGFCLEGDPARYATEGPYRGIEGQPGARALIAPKLAPPVPSQPHTVSSQRFPELFEMWLKPELAWGACHSALDGGHLHTVDFGRSVRVANGLRLALYGVEQDETYNINYLEVSVFADG